MQADEAQNAKTPIAAQIDLSGQTLRLPLNFRVDKALVLFLLLILPFEIAQYSCRL